MSTVAEVVQGVRRMLLGSYRPEFNTLSALVSSSTATFPMTFAPRGIGRGSYLAVDNEVVYVWEVSANNVTVQRAMLGTSAVSHAANSLVEIDPRFPNGLIRDEMKAEINSWPRGLFRVRTADFSLGAGDTAIDLNPTDLVDVLRVYRAPMTVLNDRWPEIPFVIKRNMPTANFASGFGLFIDRTASAAESFDLRVVYSSKFDTTTFDDTTDLSSSVGLNAALEDCLRYGAAWRMMSHREVKRTFTEGQGEPRNAEETPPGHISQIAEQMRKMRNERIAEEVRRLAAEYPWRCPR